MKLRREKWGALRRVFRLPASRDQIAAELSDEFHFHIDGRIEQFIEQGMTREQALFEVQKRFGDYQSHLRQTRKIDEEVMRQNRRFEFFSIIQSEISHSARALVRTPAFSVISIITLALGIGATTAIYTVLEAVVLRPLPYRNAGQLVSIRHPATAPGNGERKWGLSAGGYFQFRSNSKMFSDMGMYYTSGLTITNNGSADIARVAGVTASLLTTLNARAEVGRIISAADDTPHGATVAMLSHEYFERRFGGNISMIGKNLETSGGTFEIIGVAQRGLTLPMPGPFASQSNLAAFGVDVWIPLKLDPAGPFYNSHPYVGIARLRDGVPIEAAQRDLAGIASHFADVLPNVYSARFLKTYNFRTEVSNLRSAVLGPTIPRALWMVLGSIVLVMLIAAANVANLFIVRMEARRRESAVRTALGASARHMAVHYLSESWLLCGAATFLGVALAYVGLHGLLAIAPSSVPRIAGVAMSWSSVGVAAGIAFTLGTLFGIMPLFRKFASVDLREGGRGLSASPRQRGMRNGLVVGQVALALVLVAAAGLMLESFMHLRDVKPGFDSSNVTTFGISLPYAEFDTREKAFLFHRELQRKIEEIPGVVRVGSISDMPLEEFGTGCSVVFREAEPYPEGEPTPCVSVPYTAPGFFETLRIPVSGATLTWNDVDQRSQAAVVTKALAERLWPGQSAIGKGINSNGSKATTWYRVVGVVSSFRGEALDGAVTEAAFYPVTGFRPNQRDGIINQLRYLVRTSSAPPATFLKQINDIIVHMNPRVPMENVRSMEEIAQRSMSRTSFFMILLGIAAGVALMLSAVGMYGVISYLVAQRKGEIGLRIALGAGHVGVAKLIVWQSVRLAIAGVSIGMVGAYFTGKALTSFLFEVSPSDPLILVAVSLLLVSVAAAASLAPARRAAEVDLLEAMRGD